MDRLFTWPPSWSTLLLLPALFVAFTVHELAHAAVAYMLGDTSQIERKRLSFNPLRHVSWLGLVAFLLLGIGWAKPVWVDVTRLRIRNRAFGMFLVSISGATANLLLAVLTLLGISATVAFVWLWAQVPPMEILQYLLVSKPNPDLQGVAVSLTYYMVMVNLLLALFNLLPLPPLDGFQALVSLFTLMRGGLRRGAAPAEALPPAAAAAALEASDTPAEPLRSPAQIHLAIGLEYHRAGQWEEAIARYRQAAAQDPELTLAYYNEGAVYWAKGRLDLAEGAFRAAAQGGDAGVRAQAERRLHDLAGVRADPQAAAQSVPAPLESGSIPEPDPASVTPVDPAVERQVWLRLSLGGAALLCLAALAWLFVTLIVLRALS